MFKVGERVTRDAWGGPTLHGVILEVYKGQPNGLGEAPTLYAVQWDGVIGPRRGYLDGGLQRDGIRITRLLGI